MRVPNFRLYKKTSAINASNTYKLPLETFLQRLSLAGFKISPAQRINLLKVLQSTGSHLVDRPEDLKYVLCPLIAQNAAEQARFYVLFDRFIEESRVEIETQKWWERIPPYAWILAAALFLGGLGWWLGSRFPGNGETSPALFIGHPGTVAVGDTVVFQNILQNLDSAHLSVRWEILHPQKDTIEHLDTTHWHLTYVVPPPGEIPQKRVRLIGEDLLHHWRDTVESLFSIQCPDLPRATIEIENPTLAAGQTARFFAQTTEDTSALEFDWDFDDGTTRHGIRAEHVFSRAGNFTVGLKVRRKIADGACTTTLSRSVSVGTDRALPAFVSLESDSLRPTARFGVGMWLILALLGACSAWFWWRWAQRAAPPPPDAEADSVFRAAEVLPDRGPYFIPFQNQETRIRYEQDLYRFADVLRIRQAGSRKEVDVVKTLRASIEQGGFPDFKFKTNTIPTEYLVLIDRQSPNSHQSKLYEYLISFLKDKDVLVQTFYYNQYFHSFWNEAFPNGVSPEVLVRQYPHHRLLIMGDAHDLIDQSESREIRLRPDMLRMVESWKYRLLLTPLPESAWRFQEAVLHRHFFLFPSNMEGLMQAVRFLQSGRTEEDFLPFEKWREIVRNPEPEPQIQYRRWRTAADHRDYLKDQPALFQWLCALTIYPKPTWELTIAIGDALRPFGVEVNYENLLTLARIPWLREGRISEKLRLELRQFLEPEIETAAREACLRELEAVGKLVENSQAAREWMTEKTLQKFSIAPDDSESQTLLRALFHKGWLGKRHLSQLENTWARYQERKNRASFM
ncbi:MAG: PKD domain-containing protein, partial [Bacteroidetes bacterium]